MPRKSDEKLQADALRELRWDTRVGWSDIDMSVSEGIVTLTGTLTSYAKKLAAQEAARSVRGVLDVANDIEVKIPAARIP
jgi:osmotically-inducible protein OsmY